MSTVNFFTYEVNIKVHGKKKLKTWIESVIKSHNKQLKSIDFILTTDDVIYNMNLEYLNHDTFTDILTYDLSDEADLLEGDIYISLDRVRENAEIFNTTFPDELHRVMIHGILHLLGYKDDTPTSKKAMRKSEDQFLVLLAQLK